MKKSIRTEIFKQAITENGLTQSQLAKQLAVTPQAVTNWTKGTDFPRPATLLKLAAILRLTFDQLVNTNDPGQPIIAFRKKGNAKTTDAHISKAIATGQLLKPLVRFLPKQQAIRKFITSPSQDYLRIQTAALETRKQVGVGPEAVLDYEEIIGEFKNCGAILVPVMWGKMNDHKNAMHIRLPDEDVTFIFINLDTRVEDFKFWMAHELAHVYTPELSGSIKGEDFADAFAGALLFPEVIARDTYHESMRLKSEDGIIKFLLNVADNHLISINTVYEQVNQYAKSIKAPILSIDKNHLHVVRNSTSGPLLSEALFDPLPPEPDIYIAACENSFQSDFFYAIKRMIHEQDTSSSYIQQILDVSVHDAKAIYEELRH